MSKAHFGELLHQARATTGMSLRQLSAQSGIDYTRLSRMEHGTRPAPPLSEMRRLADLLSLDLADLMVAAGTPREAVEQLLWAERLQQAKRERTLANYSPLGQRAGVKNEFIAHVDEQRGSHCTARIGATRWQLVSFSNAPKLKLRVPAESIHVYREDPSRLLAGEYNVFVTELLKARKIGALTNIVLSTGGLEINALVAQERDVNGPWTVGERLVIAISPAAISTEPFVGKKGQA